jgi:hypothetical protein
MTQDQYDQARGAGYGARGDVVEDENDEYADDPGKPMTRFQKVASALRGDRPDEPGEDQVPADQAGVNSPAAAGSGMDPGPDAATDPGLDAPGTATDLDAATDPDLDAPGTATDPDAAADPGLAASGTATDPDVVPSHQGTEPWPTHRDEGAVATGPGDRAGDYWDESQAPVTGEDQVVAVTNPNVPVTDARTDPLADPDEAAGQTLPDIPSADLPAAQDPAAAPGNGSTDAGNGSAAYQDQAGAATISDVPVAQTAEDAQVSEASGRTGRHAGVPAQEMRPGDATGTLDNLGDLAYGNLVPDAADFTAQWQQIQFRFVDDPQASVTEAAEVVSQVTAKLEAAIQERQRAIAERQQAIQERQRTLQDRWGEGSQADTETLRETLRMYRAFLDQLIGPKV